MNKIVPVGQFTPYTLNDLSVVIPQASWHIRRINWFIPQFIEATPSEVIKNTIIVYDGDEHTKNIINQYHLKGVVFSSSTWSTYKQEAGFKEVKTRLCARIHNDTYFPRDNWTQTLIEQFNNYQEPQLISSFHPSGNLPKEWIDLIVEKYPSFKVISDELDFDDNKRIGSPFLAAYFTAGQTYIFKMIYPLVMEINNNKMDKEDCLLTILTSFFNIKIINWENLRDFAMTVGKPGEFDEDLDLPYKVIKTKEFNVDYSPKAEFKEVHSTSSG